MFLTIAGIFLCMVLVYVIWQKWELKQFDVTEYKLSNKKIQKELGLIVLADLHGYEYGENNCRLIKEIKQRKPEFILIAGDMIVSNDVSTFEKAFRVLEQLVKIAPVYYGFGNHESRIAIPGLIVSEAFRDYMQKVEALGVVILRNEMLQLTCVGNKMQVGSAEIGLEYYVKGHEIIMAPEYMEEIMGSNPETAEFQVLLAHNPTYSERYAQWGADLTFCGHNHGGLVRIPGIGSLISPQFTLFPKYNDNMYEINGKHVIVSRGLGTHTFHVRVFNRAELLYMRILPEK